MSLKAWWSRRSRFTDAQAARWENTRERGRDRFVLIEGVLIFGFGCGIANALIMQLVGDEGTLWIRMAINLVLFPVGGLWMGHMMWNQNERRYAEWRHGRRNDPVAHA